LRTRAIPERTTGVLTTRRYTDPPLPFYLTAMCVKEVDRSANQRCSIATVLPSQLDCCDNNNYFAGSIIRREPCNFVVCLTVVDDGPVAIQSSVAANTRCLCEELSSLQRPRPGAGEPAWPSRCVPVGRMERESSQSGDQSRMQQSADNLTAAEPAVRRSPASQPADSN